MIFDFRFGTPSDTDVIVDFILDAGGGIFEQLVEGVVPALSVRDLMAVAVTTDESPLNFNNCLIADKEGQPAGMALCYPAEQYGLPTIARGIVPVHRITPLRELLNSRLDESYYVNTLAVAKHAVGQGLGRLLLETVSDLGRSMGFDTLSLHVWVDNTSAYGLYHSWGFKVERLIEVTPSDYLRFRGPMALLSLSIAAPRPVAISARLG